MQPVNRAVITRRRSEPPWRDKELHGAPPMSEQVAEPSRKKCKWGRRAEVIPTADHASPERPEAQNVDMDPALWGDLHRYVGSLEEMVVAKLPLHAFYKARSVCKKWNSLAWNRPFLEQHSNTSLPKPYFILYGERGCHQAMLVKDVMLEKWVLKPLPAFGFQQPHTSVAHGIVYTGTIGSDVRGTVFNIHTKVFRRLPPLTPEFVGSCCVMSKLAVDKHSGSYKVLVAWSRGRFSVYDSSTSVWTWKSPSPALVLHDFDSTYCEGVMYIKWRDDFRVVSYPHRWLPSRSDPKVFAYNFEHDSWTVLPIAPGPGRTIISGLGEWKGVLRDMTLDRNNVLRVWEFEQSGQAWLEVDRMPPDILEWFFDPHIIAHRSAKIEASYCEHYILMMPSHGFPGKSGQARFVLYDMALRFWQKITVAKDWICLCPFANQSVSF